MNSFICDQTIARDRLQRKLDRMNPKTGIRRRILDLFYETGTRWTWHTVLGIILVGVPFLLVFCINSILAALAFLLSLPLVWLFDLSTDILGWFARCALRKYFRLQKDIDEIIV